MLIINFLDQDLEIYLLKKEHCLYYKKIDLTSKENVYDSNNSNLINILKNEINKSKKISKMGNEVFACLSFSQNITITNLIYSKYANLMKECGMKLKGITTANEIVKHKMDGEYYLLSNGIFNNGKKVNEFKTNELLMWLNDHHCDFKSLEQQDQWLAGKGKRIISVKKIQNKLVHFIKGKFKINQKVNLVNFALSNNINPWLINNRLFQNYQDINWFSINKTITILHSSKLSLLKA